MFIGEMLCLIVYFLKRKSDKPRVSVMIPENNQPLTGEKEEEKEKVKEEAPGQTTESKEEFKQKVEEVLEDKPKQREAKLWYFAIPSFFDFCASTLMALALTFLPSSVNEMLRGAVIIFTACASMIFLKAKYSRHHLLGIIITIAGLVVVGVNALFKQGTDKNKEGYSTGILIGIILMLTSQIFSASMYIVEEKFLKGLNAQPLFVVGMEGTWGALMYIVLLVPFYFINCTHWKKDFKKMCQPCAEIPIGEEGEEIDDGITFRFEEPILALRQIFHSTKIGLLQLLYIVSIATFNFGGVSVTKYASATSRTIINTLRTILIWIFFLTPVVPKKTHEKWSWIQLAGFILLIIGALIYNEIVELPFWGFNRYTKKAIKKRKEAEIAERSVSELRTGEGEAGKPNIIEEEGNTKEQEAAGEKAGEVGQ